MICSSNPHNVKGFSKELYSDIVNNAFFFDKCPETRFPVKIVTYIRTDKDNLIMLNSDEEFSVVSDCEYPRKPDNISYLWESSMSSLLHDFVILAGKKVIESCFEFTDISALQFFVQNSSCFAVGAAFVENTFYIVSNLVISVSVLHNKNIVLKDGHSFYPIELLDLSKVSELDKEVFKSVVLVKRGSKNNE